MYNQYTKAPILYMKDLMRGIKTEMEREQEGESPIPGNTESYKAGILETLEKKAEH